MICFISFLNTFVSSRSLMIGVICSLLVDTYYAEQPPIVDIYENSPTFLAVNQLNDTIKILKEELATTHKALEEKTKQIEALQKKNRFSWDKLFKCPRFAFSTIHSGALSKRNWREAMHLLRSEQYGEAMHRFKQFIAQYPAHANQASSYYFLGQLALLEGDTIQSIHYLNQFVEKYEKDSRIPEAKFHIGLAYYAQPNHAMAHLLFTEVIAHYPEHPIAKRAEEYLKRIKLHGENES